MPEFMNWRGRLTAAGGLLPKVVRATRKSSREEEKQKYSHEQQLADMETAWGQVEDAWVWSESRSGTSFERPMFQDLLDFCRSNPRPKSDPGRVEWWAPHRFGRSLDENGDPDILKFMSVYFQFEDAGWQLHFLKVPRLNHPLGDVMNIAVHAYAAAVYSKDLSENASRGRRSMGGQGWWVNAQAPWGTLRFDMKLDRVLKKGEPSSPGSGGTILVEDPEVMPHWGPSADLFLAGESYEALGEVLYEKGLRGPQGGALKHKHIRNWLTNRHLIGEVLTRDVEYGKVWNKAKWAPLVDVEKFRRVQEEVARRENDPRNIKRTSKGTFILTPVCASCGSTYHGGRNGKTAGNHRTYVHSVPDERLHAQHADYVAHGCRAWSVVAHELEDAIKDLILQERASDGYEAEVRAALAEREKFRNSSQDAIAAAEKRIKEFESEYAVVARDQMRAGKQGRPTEPYDEELTAITQRLTAAKHDLDTAQQFAAERQVQWDRIAAAIDETRNLADAWDAVSLEQRRAIFDWWVLDVLISVEPLASGKRGKKTAIVTLRSAPDAPRYFTFERSRSSVAPTSSSTNGSCSAAADACSAASAAREPTCPSAHAACPRTNGSGSESAAVSTGTASAEPQLPSATATLRKKPARPARRNGEPRENASQPDSSIDMSSTSDGDRVPGCQPSEGSFSTPYGGSPAPLQANAGSDAGPENFRGNGHTSWQMSHPKTRFPMSGRSSTGIGPRCSIVR